MEPAGSLPRCTTKTSATHPLPPELRASIIASASLVIVASPDHSRASGNPLRQPLRTLNQKQSTRLHTTCYLFGGGQRKEENL